MGYKLNLFFLQLDPGRSIIPLPVWTLGLNVSVGQIHAVASYLERTGKTMNWWQD